MSASFPVAFPSSANPLSGNLSRKDASTRIEYRLLELPLDLCSLIEEGKLEEFSIKGKLEDEAVFCTPTSTYSLRSISVSNSHVILSQSAADDHGLVIQAQVNEILEVLPIVPKLERLRALLLNSEFKIGEPLPELDGESASNAVYNEEAEPGQSETKYRPIRYEYARGVVQASEEEFHRALRDYHILNVTGILYMISIPTLSYILLLILDTIVINSQSPNCVSLFLLYDGLSSGHEIPHGVITQIVEWFGKVDKKKGVWKVDVDAVVKHIGLGVLSEYKYDPVSEDDFVKAWTSKVGDTFESDVNLKLLAGFYLPSDTTPLMLTYFPSNELPTAPSARFADLFSTRAKWQANHIVPFLSDIAVDSKERDKLLLKFCRSTTDEDGVVWYGSRGR